MKIGSMIDKMGLTVRMNPDRKDLYDSFVLALRGDDKPACLFYPPLCEETQIMVLYLSNNLCIFA